MEPVPAKRVKTHATLEIDCGTCGVTFYRTLGKETAICPCCETPNNLATTWNERKDNDN